MYSELPPEDEQLIHSEHVEDIYWNKFRKKELLIGSYYPKILVRLNNTPLLVFKKKFVIVSDLVS